MKFIFARKGIDKYIWYMTRKELIEHIQSNEPFYQRITFRNYSDKSLLRIKKGIEVKKCTQTYLPHERDIKIKKN